MRALFLKIAVIVIVFFSLGILVLPSTVSLFAGQHLWYNLSGTGNNVPCGKCHADVYDELTANSTAPHSNMRCESCHRANLSVQYASVTSSYTSATPGKQAHAATVVACMLCHQINASQASATPGPYAGGFNVTMMGVSSPYNYSNATYSGKYEAHNAFVARAVAGAANSSMLLDSNEACVACHMKVNTTMHFNVTYSISMTVNEVIAGPYATGFNESYLNVSSSSYSFTNVTEVKG